MYPQCGWLLLVKLYHNEVLQLINLVSDKWKILHENQCNDGDDAKSVHIDVRKSNNLNHLNMTILMYSNRLFLFQLATWFTAIHAFVVYSYCIFFADTNERGLWNLLWCCQMFIASVMILVMPFSMKSALNIHAKLC